MNILIAGHCNASFIVPWVNQLKNHYPNSNFSILGLNNINPDEIDITNSLFDNIYSIPKNQPFPKKGRLNLVFFLLKKITFKKIWKNISSIKQLICTEYNSSLLLSFYRQISKNQDIIFIHYITPENLEIVKHLKSETKIAFCFWGSDLMQASSKKEWLSIKNNIGRANSIIVQNYGMKFIFCSKYGWENENKIKIAPFLVNQNIFNLINVTTKTNSRDFIANKTKIDKDKIWVSCGYRSVPMIQQDKILNVLGELKDEDKRKIVFFIFMGNGVKNDEYIKSVLSILEKNNFNYVVISNYLSDIELAHFRKAIDIFIHFPLSDAMSLTMLEHLYAGNYVITNSNLPYSIFRKYNLEYDEVDNPSDILGLLQKKIFSCTSENINNRHKVKSLIENEFTLQNWINVINE